MPFAVEIFFDPATEASVRGVWQRLASAGLMPDHLLQQDARPHVTLGVCAELDPARFQPALVAFAERTPVLDVAFASIGGFPSVEGVLFLAPVVTRDLLELHAEFHRRLFAGFAVSPWAYYLPGQWVPHCTLTLSLPRDRLMAAVDACWGMALPHSGRFEALGLVAFPPVSELYTAPLAQSGGQPASRV